MLDPEKLLGQFGGPGGLSEGNGRAAVRTPAPARFCSFCWCTLPDDADRCADCGHTVAEMEQARAETKAQDATWIPPRQQTKKARKAASVEVGPAPSAPDPAPNRSSVPEPVAMEIRKTRNHFLLAVVVGSAWGGAVMVAAYVTLSNKNTPPVPGNAPARTAPLPNRPVQVGAYPLGTKGPGDTNGPGATNGPAEAANVGVTTMETIVWPPAEEIPKGMVALVCPKGSHGTPGSERVASDNPKSHSVLPGDYEIWYKAPKMGWGGRMSQPFKATVSGSFDVAPPSDQIKAAYYLWLGSKYYYDKEKNVQRAEQSLRDALRYDPKLSDARVQLAALLIDRSQLDEARKEIDTVLAAEPRNPGALKLKQGLDELQQVQNAKPADAKEDHKPETQP